MHIRANICGHTYRCADENTDDTCASPSAFHPLKPDLPSELLHFPCLERLLSSLDGSIVFYVIHNQDIGEKIRTKANQVDTNDKSNGRRGHPTTTTTPSCQGNYMQQLPVYQIFLECQPASKLPSRSED